MGPDNSPFRGLCRQRNPQLFSKNAKLMYKWRRNYILNIFKSLILLLAFHEK